MTEKDVKSCFSIKINFDQQTACGALVSWSKYTTARVSKKELPAAEN